MLSRGRKQFRAEEVAAACLCAGGTTRPPRGDRLAGLVERLKGSEAFVATLAGARIEAGAKEVVFMRDAGETARGGLQPIRLTPNTPAVWDGRFEITADRPLAVHPLKGLAARLPAAERAGLSAIPAAARPALPALVDAAGTVHCPILSAEPHVAVRSLVLERFRAATGHVRHEDDLAS